MRGFDDELLLHTHGCLYGDLFQLKWNIKNILKKSLRETLTNCFFSHMDVRVWCKRTLPQPPEHIVWLMDYRVNWWSIHAYAMGVAPSDTRPGDHRGAGRGMAGNSINRWASCSNASMENIWHLSIASFAHENHTSVAHGEIHTFGNTSDWEAFSVRLRWVLSRLHNPKKPVGTIEREVGNNVWGSVFLP
jgi:hypothetical protein